MRLIVKMVQKHTHKSVCVCVQVEISFVQYNILLCHYIKKTIVFSVTKSRKSLVVDRRQFDCFVFCQYPLAINDFSRWWGHCEMPEKFFLAFGTSLKANNVLSSSWKLVPLGILVDAILSSLSIF